MTSTVKVERDYDAERLNRIVNDPTVFPWVALPGQTELDLSAVVADTRNYALMCDEGGILALQMEPGIYELHTQFLPSMRGRRALNVINEILFWLYTRTDALELLTQVPVNNAPAMMMALAVNATLDFERAACWPPGESASKVSVKYFALRYNDWLRTSPLLEPAGKTFHTKLEEEYARLGLSHAAHADDAAHDRAVGACVATLAGGLADKAIILYNRWARFAGYSTIRCAGFHPLLVDISEATIEVNGPDWKVVKANFQPAQGLQEDGPDENQLQQLLKEAS